MEYIIEFLLELVLEGSMEVSKSSKVPKYVRYPLIGILALFFLAVIGVLFAAGILSFKENAFAGILLISVGLFFVIMCLIKLRKIYLTKIDKE